MIKKTVSAILVVAFIFALCALSTYAAVSYYVTASFYPPNDTKAEATIYVQGESNPYDMSVWIESNSTGERSENYAVQSGGSASLSSGKVTIYYPGAEIPLINYGGYASE